MIRHAVIRHRPHDHARAQQRLVYRRRRALEVDAHKVSDRRDVAQAKPAKARDQLPHALVRHVQRARQVRLIVERRGGGHERQAVDVERRAHAVENIGHLGRRHAVADAQAGEAVHLREGARHNQVRVLSNPLQRVRVIARAHGRVTRIFEIRLVNHRHDLRRQRAQKRVELGARQPGTGRVVGVGDEHQPRLWTDGTAQGGEVVAPVFRRHGHGARAGGLGEDRIDGKGMLREQYLARRRHERTHGEVENVARTVAERDLPCRDAEFRAQLLLEHEAVAVRVERNAVERRAQGGERARARAERILVRGQLDGVLHAVLAFELLDWLAGLVWRDGAHTGRGEIDNFITHKKPNAKAQRRKGLEFSSKELVLSILLRAFASSR